MGVEARIKKDGSLLLKNAIDERLPVITNGLVAYYPFDGSVRNNVLNLPQTTKVLGYYGNAGGHPWYDWFNSNTTLTNTTDIIGISLATAQTYDLIIVDCYIWDVSSVIMSKLKEFVDGGVSCIATGNDSRTNVFVLEYNDTMIATHDIEIITNIVEVSNKIYSGYGSNDLLGGINKLAPNCIQYYKRTDINAITGYFYKSSVSNAVLYYDQEGTLNIANDFVMKAIVYCYNRSISNVVNLNTIYADDGIVVQEATTNLISSIYPDFSSWSGFSGESKEYLAPNGSVGVVLNGLTSGGVMWRGAILPNSQVIPNTTYTISCKIKFISDIVHVNFFYIRQFDSNWNQITEYGVYSPSNRIKLDNGYYFTWGTFTTASNCTYIIVQGYEYNAPNTIWCYDLQLEQRSFATTYVKGSKSDGILQIPIVNLLNNTTTTINFDYYNYYGVSSTIISGSATAYSPPNGLWWGLYRDGSGVVYNHWLDGTTSRTEWVQPINTWANYTLSWDSSYEYLFVNGVLKNQKAKSANLPTNQLPIISLGYGWNRGDGKFKNFKLYNRTLTTDEVKQLAGETFKISTSKVVTTQYIESPVIPNDGYYFPLTSNAKDSGGVISPTEETNIVYEDGSVWVGSATANLLPSPQINSYPTYGNSWGTYNTNQYNGNSYFSIGVINDVTNNIVTTTTPHPLRTYDVVRPQTSGGGLIAETDYFIKKLSATSFTIHQYNSSQDGSQGYINPDTNNHKVYDSIAYDNRIAVNASNFPTMWWGAPHLPNSGLVKEIIPNGFRGVSNKPATDCIRLHYIREDLVMDSMAYGADATVVQNSPVTISFYARSVTPSAVGKVCSCQIYNYSGYHQFNFTLGKLNAWNRYSLTFTPTTSTQCITYWFPESGVYKYDIADIQYEQKSFNSLFTPTSLGASSLEYNLNSSIGLDWSGNWTICYWKKPIGTANDTLDHLNIESLGCNSNSVGGSYIWWGKGFGTNVMDSCTPSTFASADYFNLWQFVTLVKNGNFLYIRTQLNNGVTYVRTTADLTGIAANGYVTQYGYDLKLGGWDNQGSPNTYYRDLIVCKRALSDVEIRDIYKQFSIYKTKVYSKNLIEEGI